MKKKPKRKPKTTGKAPGLRTFDDMIVKKKG